MRKPTTKQLGIKTTWSPKDRAELFEALPRLKSDYSRAVLLVRRAKSISAGHPDGAIALLDQCLADYPNLVDYLQLEAVIGLGVAYALTGKPQIGAARMQQFVRQVLALDPKNIRPLSLYIDFVAEHQVASHYQHVIDLAECFHPDTPGPDLPRTNNLGTSWHIYCGTAYVAHLFNDAESRTFYLNKARALHLHENRRAPDTWRLWLFHEAKMGARSVTPVLVRPDFSLSEMRDWAAQTFRTFAPEIGLGPSKFGERLTLSWDAFCVDLIIVDSPKRAGNYVSYFTKKRLGKFDTDGAKALFWADAGDVDDVDAINTSIQILDYFQKDPRIIVNLD